MHKRKQKFLVKNFICSSNSFFIVFFFNFYIYLKLTKLLLDVSCLSTVFSTVEIPFVWSLPSAAGIGVGAADPPISGPFVIQLVVEVEEDLVTGDWRLLPHFLLAIQDSLRPSVTNFSNL
jgi:hypothetical protein